MATKVQKRNKSSKSPNEIDWNKQFDKVARYSQSQFGFTVYAESDAEYGKIDFNKQEIVIKQIYNNKENMTYLLLHELGHVIQTNKKSLYKRRVLEVAEIVTKSSLSFRIAMLYEEMDAWNEGYDFAKKIRIPLDRKKFETYKSRCLKTYMSWALNTNKKSPKAKGITSILVELPPAGTIDEEQQEKNPRSKNEIIINNNSRNNKHYLNSNSEEEISKAITTIACKEEQGIKYEIV